MLGALFRIHTGFSSSESAQTLQTSLYNRNRKKYLFETAVATVLHPSLPNTLTYHLYCLRDPHHSLSKRPLCFH